MLASLGLVPLGCDGLVDGLVDGRTLRAVSRGAGVALDGWAGRVVVASAAAAYIGDADGGLVVLRDVASFKAGTNTSTSVVVPSYRMHDWTVDGWCRVHRGRLVGPRVTVDLRGVAVWRPRSLSGMLRESVLTPDELNSFNRVVGAAIPLRRSADVVGSRLDTLVSTLVAAESTSGDDIPAAVLENAVRALVGFGPGLTPSGDDAIVGTLAILHALGLSHLVGRLASVLAGLVGRTTIVATHQLRRAVVGDFAEPIVAVVEALAWWSGSGACGPVGAALRTLLGVGATSGADTLLGMIVALETFARSDAAAPAPS